jgi:hypothetical protein
METEGDFSGGYPYPPARVAIVYITSSTFLGKRSMREREEKKRKRPLEKEKDSCIFTA